MIYEVFKTQNSTYCFDNETKLFRRADKLNPKPILYLGSLDLSKAKIHNEIATLELIPSYIHLNLKKGGTLPGFTPSFVEGFYAIGFHECRPEDIAAIGNEEIYLRDNFRMRDLTLRVSATSALTTVIRDLSSEVRGYHLLDNLLL